jgi:3-oxoacyl-[acyl-carrier-protein] synthase II
MTPLWQPHRVAVTGIGLVTPFGPTRAQSWQALKRGESATRWLDSAELDMPIRSCDSLPYPRDFVGAPAPAAPKTAALKAKSIIADDLIDEPVIALALQAARESLDDAAVDIEARDRTRLGCVIGTSKGGLRSLTRAMRREWAGIKNPPSTSVWRQFPPNMPAAVVAAEFGLEGPCLCPVAACATGLMSLCRGFELVRDGHCDMVLAGSSDASLCISVLASFRRLGVLARGFDDPATACRPFDRHRDGFVVGEGAAVLVMERLDHALQRGARPYAEWVTAGYAADVSGLTRLEAEPTSLVRLIRDVLRRADLTSSEIDYANLHGTATLQNDLCETRALKQALGPAARTLCCSSSKGGLGHLLGAAGSVETAAALLAMRESVVPPTVNLTESDSGCDLDYTPRQPRPRRIENVLKLSLGFGGHLVAAVLRAAG